MRARALLIAATTFTSIAALAPVAAASSGGASAPGATSASSGPRQAGGANNNVDSPPPGPTQGSGQSSAASGGSAFILPARKSPGRLTVAGNRARIIHGLAYAPENAPMAVKYAIWAGNRIVGLPYVWGGGHQAFKSTGYDCSGTVSYALHGGHLLSTPMDSTELEGWGQAGAGHWITVFANGGHTYMDIAGIRLDTSRADDPNGGSGPRWRPLRQSNAGYVVRHPIAL